MLTEPTLEKLTELRLHALARSWQEQQQDAEVAELTFDERFALLVDAEWMDRRNKRLARHLREAKLRIGQACIEDIDFPATRKLDKKTIRTLSARYGLPTADKPASPCLSSRFPYGTRITQEGLARVARAEGALHALGLRELRVRHLDDRARVEISAIELPLVLTDPAVRARVESAVLASGFPEVEICEQPLRSGSLNDAILSEGDPRRSI